MNFPPLKSILSGDRPFWSAMGQAILIFTTRFGGAACNFVFALLLARLFPKAEVGFILLLNSFVQLAALATTLNVENTAVRFLLQPYTKGNLSEAHGFVRYIKSLFIRLCPFVMGGMILILVVREYLAAGLNDDGLTYSELTAIVLASLMIPLFTGLRLGNRYGSALNKVVESTLPWAFFRPLVLVALTAGLLLSDVPPNVPLLVIFALIGAVIAVALQKALLRGMMSDIHAAEPDLTRKDEWKSTALYLAAPVVFFEYFQNLVLFSAAFGLDDSTLGLLAISVQFIGFLRMGIMAVNASTAPKLSRAITKGEDVNARRLLAQTTLLKAGPMVLITLCVWLIAPWLVSLFGPGYEAAASALRIIALLPLISSMVGPSVMMLNIVGHQRAIFKLSLICLAILVVAVPIGGKLFGLVGAAGAATLVMASWEFLLWRKTCGLTGYDGSVLGAIRHLR